MPIEATLLCIRGGKLAEFLKEAPSLATQLGLADLHSEWARVDVLGLLMVEDLYGRKYAAPVADAAVWEDSETVPVLGESDLGALEYTNYVGTWNLKFLRWLKTISERTAERIEIDYFHERGDNPHESAWWNFDPTSPDGIVEAFGIENHDDTPPWKREVLRHADGHIELRVDQCPRGGQADASQ